MVLAFEATCLFLTVDHTSESFYAVPSCRIVLAGPVVLTLKFVVLSFKRVNERITHSHLWEVLRSTFLWNCFPAVQVGSNLCLIEIPFTVAVCCATFLVWNLSKQTRIRVSTFYLFSQWK